MGARLNIFGRAGLLKKLAPRLPEEADVHWHDALAALAWRGRRQLLANLPTLTPALEAAGGNR